MNLLQDAKFCVFVLALLGANVVRAQKTQPQPVNDSAAQASPLGPTLNTPSTDSSEQASPIDESRRRGQGVPAHTSVRIVLNQNVDSGSLKNGQIIHGKVSSAVYVPSGVGKRSSTSLVKAGTPVSLSVIATVPAGKLNAVGEMSLQLVQIGGRSVFTDTQTFRGKPGPRDLPDSAPVLGTNAGLSAGQELTFTIQPEPGFVERAPQPSQNTPGSVTGLASGSKPANFGKPIVASPSSNSGSTAAGGTTNTPQPVQHAGQVAATPNQPAAPANASPTTATQPH